MIKNGIREKKETLCDSIAAKASDWTMSPSLMSWQAGFTSLGAKAIYMRETNTRDHDTGIKAKNAERMLSSYTFSNPN